MSKKSQKELKRPDFLQKKFFTLAYWTQTHQRHVFLVVGPIVILALLGVSWHFWSKHKTTQLREELAAIDEQYNKEETEANTKKEEISKKIEELENKNKPKSKEGVTGEDAPDATVAQSPETKKQVDDLNKQMDFIKAEHGKTLVQYLDFYKKHETQTEGFKAALSATSIYVKEERYQEAADILPKLLQVSKGVPFYQYYARNLYVSLLEELNRVEDAIKEVDLLLPTATVENKPKVLLTKARLLFTNGRKEDAQQVLTQITTDHGASTEAKKAQSLKAFYSGL